MRIFISLAIIIVMGLQSLPAAACTLWSANGTAAAGGGSMIVKNRDWRPDHRQEVRVVAPAAGYKYAGLFVVGGGLRAGINEKGLVVVSATAGSVPEAERKAEPHVRNLCTRLLEECAGVDEVLAKSGLFFGPQILMVADRRRVATIEIGPAGACAVDTRENGCLFHTNHYIGPTMLKFNALAGRSSQKRYERIGELLAGGPEPFTLEAFLAFAADENDGPDNSIFRRGSTPRATRTMAIWATAVPASGSPLLYVRLLNPGEDERIYRVTVDDLFAGKAVL